jgi:chemotaxis protein MotB
MPDARIPPARSALPAACCRRGPLIGGLCLLLLLPAAGCGGSRQALVARQQVALDSLATVVRSLRTERDSLQAALHRTRSRVDTLTVYVEQARDLTQEVKAQVDAAFQQRADSLRHHYVLDFLRGQEQAGRLQGQTLEVIYFESGATAPGGEALERLNRLAARLRRLPASARILVEGHSDDIPFAGTRQDRNNRTLSAERAAAVKQVLVERSGLPGGRFEAAGFGADAPLFPNEDAAQRRFNRRVRIAVLEP